MTGEKIEIEGLARLGRQFKKLGEDFKTGVKVSNAEAAKIIAADARNRAPIGTSQYDDHPGALLLSIRARFSSRGASVTAGSATVPYAAPIHWGWPKRGIRPNPFLYRALDARRAEVIALYAKRVADLERKAFP